MPDWIGSHVRSFSYLGSVPAIVVPDNIKSGVHLAHRYEPELNPTYAEMAEPYQKADTRGRLLGPKFGYPAFSGLLSVRYRPKADTRIPSTNPVNAVALTAATTLLQTELVSLCKRRYHSR